jgi:hypothetical protein
VSLNKKRTEDLVIRFNDAVPRHLTVVLPQRGNKNILLHTILSLSACYHDSGNDSVNLQATQLEGITPLIGG